MTIKKRLAASNLIMILVPIGITLIIAAACVLLIWFTIARGTGLGFEDSENFYQASSGISVLATEALERQTRGERLEALKMLSSFLDRGAMSLVVAADGEGFYQYGEDTSFMENPTLTAAAQALDYDGTLTKGNHNLHVQTFDSQGTNYIIYIFNTQKQLSYGSLKVAAMVSGGILIVTILCSVSFTDRFLIRFVFRHIEEPLDLLSNGVRQISQGNLNFHLDYDGQDEFLPVCQDFNFMAQQLHESVERSRREEESRKELMAGLSHDLRSPLTSIHAYVEGLLDGIAPSPEAQRTYLMTIRRKTEELETMVARILAYSRMDMDQVSRNAVWLQLDEFLKAEWMMFLLTMLNVGWKFPMILRRSG